MGKADDGLIPILILRLPRSFAPFALSRRLPCPPLHGSGAEVIVEGMFFSSGTTLIRTLVVGVLAYISLVLLLRLSGRRTLSKMNAFDLVVTVALGSTFATILLNRDVPGRGGAGIGAVDRAAVRGHLVQRTGGMGAADGDG